MKMKNKNKKKLREMEERAGEAQKTVMDRQVDSFRIPKEQEGIILE